MADVCVNLRNILYAAEVADYVGSASALVDNTWFMELGKLAAKPDTCIGIIDSGGKDPNPKWLIDYPSVQFLVRGAKNAGHVDVKAKAVAIKDVLLGFQSNDVGGDRYVAINMIGDINNLGYDQDNRAIFSVNFSLIVCPAASDLTTREAL